MSAIQQLIEFQLLCDGLRPDRLHLVGGDEPDEEASFFEALWRQAWRRAASDGRCTEALAAVAQLCERRAELPRLRVALLSTAPSKVLWSN